MDFPGCEVLTVISCVNLFVNETVSSFFTGAAHACDSLSHVNFKLEMLKIGTIFVIKNVSSFSE